MKSVFEPSFMKNLVDARRRKIIPLFAGPVDSNLGSNFEGQKIPTFFSIDGGGQAKAVLWILWGPENWPTSQSTFSSSHRGRKFETNLRLRAGTCNLDFSSSDEMLATTNHCRGAGLPTLWALKLRTRKFVHSEGLDISNLSSYRFRVISQVLDLSIGQIGFELVLFVPNNLLEL